jgi:hypothetical protein
MRAGSRRVLLAAGFGGALEIFGMDARNRQAAAVTRRISA